MRTVEDVVQYLTSELDKSYAKYGFWKDRDSNEASKHLIAAHEIEDLIDEICARTEEERKNETDNCKPVKILTEESKEKPSFLTIYVNIYSFVLFVSSFLFMSSLIDRVLDYYDIFQGFAGSLITYVCYIVHIISFVLFSVYANRTYKTKK